MLNVKKLFFVPVGLPGMGKSTLAKNIRLSVENSAISAQQAANLKQFRRIRSEVAAESLGPSDSEHFINRQPL